MKIKHMFILLAASVSTASCGFLDEYDPNSTTVGNFYKSEADIVTSLTSSTTIRSPRRTPTYTTATRSSLRPFRGPTRCSRIWTT